MTGKIVYNRPAPEEPHAINVVYPTDDQVVFTGPQWAGFRNADTNEREWEVPIERVIEVTHS